MTKSTNPFSGDCTEHNEVISISYTFMKQDKEHVSTTPGHHSGRTPFEFQTCHNLNS